MEKTHNELIAEFMGFDGFDDGFTYKLNGSFLGRAIHITELKYETSWDWLMPVIEKIRLICEENHQQAQPPTEDMELFDKIFDDGLFWLNINTTYLKVLQWINWYNASQEVR